MFWNQFSCAKFLGRFSLPIETLDYATTTNRVRALDVHYVTNLTTNAEVNIKSNCFTSIPPALGTINYDVDVDDLKKRMVTIEITDCNHTLMAQKQMKEKFPHVKDLEKR